MKKHFAGLLAIAFAIVSFAFTNTTSTKKDFFDCLNPNLAWFIVQTDDCLTSNQSAFNEVVSDNNNSVYVGTKEAFLSSGQNGICNDEGDCICAFGIDKSKLTLVSSPNIYSIPTTGVTYTDIECVVLREE